VLLFSLELRRKGTLTRELQVFLHLGIEGLHHFLALGLGVIVETLVDLHAETGGGSAPGRQRCLGLRPVGEVLRVSVGDVPKFLFSSHLLLNTLPSLLLKHKLGLLLLVLQHTLLELLVCLLMLLLLDFLLVQMATVALFWVDLEVIDPLFGGGPA